MYVPLLLGLLENVLLHRPLRDETVDVDFACLPDAVASILRLRVHGRIPVRVVEHNRVCSGEVDSDPPASRRENEAEHALVHVEPVSVGQ